MAINESHSVASETTNATTFGFSKSLTIPVLVKLCLLRASGAADIKLASNSKKYENPELFKKLLQISENSDLYVQASVVDQNQNPLTCPVQTHHRLFSSNRRVWNTYVKLPMAYNQLSYGDYVLFEIFEIVETKPVMFGQGCISLFDHSTGLLRRGAHNVAIANSEVSVSYGKLQESLELEKSLVKYENGDYAKVAWLDRLALPTVEKLRGQDAPEPVDLLYILHMEFPNFRMPVVFADITYKSPEFELNANYMDENRPGDATTPAPTMVINSIDIPVPGDTPKVYDPDFHTKTLQQYNSVVAGQQSMASAVDGPVEEKYQVLAATMHSNNDNLVVDRELKPLPAIRDELRRIMRTPASGTLSDHDKRLVWKFRFFFSKTTSPEDAQSNRLFLPKFLKCFNWDNEYELEHAFREILPLWPARNIEIGDALEFLGNSFDPDVLAAPLRRRMITTPTTKDLSAAEEKKLEKIRKSAMRLREYAVERLAVASADELQLYLLQLVQALKYETVDGEINNKDNSEEFGLSQAPLSRFLIERAVANGALGNFFYWFVKVENEDQIQQNGIEKNSIFSVTLNTYISVLKDHCARTKLPQYRYLRRQIAFIKKLTGLVELLRTKFKKNEATSKKSQFLREYLADSANDMLKFADPFPLPLDPSVMVCGCYPAESLVFKSSMAPLKITLKTVAKENTSQSSQIFGSRKLHGKYPLMFKIGDDLRQDQLIIQIITLMDQLLKNENLDLRLTPYKILATSPIAGLIQFVPNETLDSVLSKNYGTDASPSMANGILCYLQQHSRTDSGTAPTSDLGVSPVIMDNYIKSCAGYCVITYLLGVGDRHLDNLLLSPDGRFWHADFGYILGRDPKPFPPLMKLPIQVIDGMGGMNHENFNMFKNYCFIVYSTLRRSSNLILNLFQLMLSANIPDIQIDRTRAVEKVEDKFALQMSEEEAILHFQNLIIDSVNAFLPVVIDALHSLAQYWRA